jgi:hypothetical protein
MRAPICREGEYSEGRSPVTNNAYSIPQRLKEVDDRFFVMYNRDTGKFEVHVRGQQGTTLGCELPFPDLDYRAIEYVRKYKADRTRANQREVEVFNDKLEQTTMRNTFSKANDKMAETIHYLDHHPSQEDIPKELIAE